jgi:hypothetical protein
MAVKDYTNALGEAEFGTLRVPAERESRVLDQHGGGERFGLPAVENRRDDIGAGGKIGEARRGAEFGCNRIGLASSL